MSEYFLSKTMSFDIDKYYYKNNGTYVVHFPNSKELSMDKIREMFSEYGEVSSIDDRGNSKGLWFVRYVNLDDAINCIKGFKNNSAIKILPHKSKLNPSEATNNKPKQDKNNEKFKQKYTNGKNTSDVDKPQSRYSLLGDYNSSRDSDTASNYSSNNIRSMTPMLPVPLMQLSTTHIPKDLEIQIPPLVSVDQKYKTNNIKPSPQMSQKTILAEEVIVANIDSSLSIHYILHLFEKHNPIAVSSMKKTDIGLNYCHVYYKTKKDAEATMKEFDSYSLHGKNLIVLTTPKLREETF